MFKGSSIKPLFTLFKNLMFDNGSFMLVGINIWFPLNFITLSVDQAMTERKLMQINSNIIIIHNNLN